MLLNMACVTDDLTTDCSSDKETMQIQFTLSMSGGKTRATTWGDKYDDEAASVWENTINEGQLQVLLYDNSNKLMGEVQNLTYVRHTGETDNNIYDIVGDLTVDVIGENTSTLNGKLVVLANYESTVATTKNSSLDAIKQQEFSLDGINGNTKYIPMWGVHTLSNLTLVKGERADAGTIYMLRSVAKVRVALDDATAQNYTLAAPTLSDNNTQGYCEPSNFTAVAETTELGYESSGSDGYLTCFNPNATSAGTNLAFNPITEGKSYVVYVPEYKYNDGKPTISVTLTPKEGTYDSEKTATIELKKYKDGTATGTGLDIVRNTIYDYIITVDKKVSPTLQYQVMVWETGGGEIIFK